MNPDPDYINTDNSRQKQRTRFKVSFLRRRDGFIRILGLACLILLMGSSLLGSGRELTPEQYFGESYVDAAEFCRSNSNMLVNFFNGYGLDANEALSVVFPEIIRYNRFRDFAETTTLVLAYVQGGKSVADFSIGRFQMKPSFVEALEQKVVQNPNFFVRFKEIASYPSSLSDREIRQERVHRLMQTSWQLRYLACFIRITEQQYSAEIVANPLDRLLILATAYNRGIVSSYGELKLLSTKKTFPYGSIINGRFSYYDVSQYYYTHHAHLTLTVKR
jgi:hypothetical protein